VEADGRAFSLRAALYLAKQLIEERETAQLPVADDIEPASLLHGDHLVDRAVLDLLELLRRQLAGFERGPRLPQVAGTQ